MSRPLFKKLKGALVEFKDTMTGKTKSKKRKVRAVLKIKNWDEYYEETMRDGIGFDITDRNGVDEKKNRTENGIYSSKYGSNWGDENVFADKYACECRQTIGKRNEGEYCEECGTQVQYRDSNLKITGWITLKSDKLIHPGMFLFLQSLIGTNRLANILKSELETNLKGDYIEIDFEEINKSKDKERYNGIGLINFIIHFDEIIDFFYSKNKKKKDVYDFILEHRDKVFVSHIPIYSSFIRPVVVTSERMSFFDINSIIEIFNVKCWRLNNEKKNMVLKDYYRTLESAQAELMDMYTSIRNSLVGKKGDIRKNILGTRCNFTSRNVIVPLSGTRINEIELPYSGFLELYKPEIINLLIKMSGITMYEALTVWNRGSEVFDKRLYEIMNLLITKGDLYVGINRNPTIEYGSILAMKVVRVSKDIDNYCMAIPLQVLGPLAGDFDGDVLNIISFKGKDMIAAARLKFDPRLNMQISRIDGEFNDRVSLIKDQTISLHYFASL
ncbi:hypothetical protein V6O07_23485 [Arthrospira platensis SPKY2]